MSGPTTHLSKREIILLATFAVVTVLSAWSALNWHHYRFNIPAFRSLVEKEMLLDLNGAVIRYKMEGVRMDLLSPQTPMPVIFEMVRRYIDPKSHLLEIGPDEYHDLLKSLKSTGSGVEFIFVRYHSVKYPD